MENQLAGHELVGQRRTAPGSLVNLWFKATSAIVKYGFSIEYRDLEPPRTGIFDGLRISIDPDVDFEMQCFILLHLFGHSVQWTAPSLAEKLAALKDTADKAVFMQASHSVRISGGQIRHAADARDRRPRPGPMVQRFCRDRLAICREGITTPT